MLAALSLVLLTACSGGGGGGGGTGGGTPIAPVEFRSTKTYKRAQETENKPFYMEYWLGSNDSGKWETVGRTRMMPTKSGDSNKHISPVPG